MEQSAPGGAVSWDGLGLLNASRVGAEEKWWRAGLQKEPALLSSAESQGELGEGRMIAADQQEATALQP